MAEDSTSAVKEECYFHSEPSCPDNFDEEVGRFYVEIEGKLRMAHRECYNRYKSEKFNIRIVIK